MTSEQKFRLLSLVFFSAFTALVVQFGEIDPRGSASELAQSIPDPEFEAESVIEVERINANAFIPFLSDPSGTSQTRDTSTN